MLIGEYLTFKMPFDYRLRPGPVILLINFKHKLYVSHQ